MKFYRDETAGTNGQIGAVGLQSVYRWRSFRKYPVVGDSMVTKLSPQQIWPLLGRSWPQKTKIKNQKKKKKKRTEPEILKARELRNLSQKIYSNVQSVASEGNVYILTDIFKKERRTDITGAGEG